MRVPSTSPRGLSRTRISVSSRSERKLGASTHARVTCTLALRTQATISGDMGVPGPRATAERLAVGPAALGARAASSARMFAMSSSKSSSFSAGFGGGAAGFGRGLGFALGLGGGLGFAGSTFFSGTGGLGFGFATGSGTGFGGSGAAFGAAAGSGSAATRSTATTGGSIGPMSGRGEKASSPRATTCAPAEIHTKRRNRRLRSSSSSRDSAVVPNTFLQHPARAHSGSVTMPRLSAPARRAAAIALTTVP